MYKAFGYVDYPILVAPSETKDKNMVEKCLDEARTIVKELIDRGFSERTAVAVIRKAHRTFRDGKANGLCFADLLGTFSDPDVESEVEQDSESDTTLADTIIFIRNVQENLKVEPAKRWKDKVTRDMLLDFNFLVDSLALAETSRNAELSTYQLRQKNLTLQMKVRTLTKQVSKQKHIIAELGGKKRIPFMKSYEKYREKVGRTNDIAKYVISAVADGHVDPKGIQYEFSLLQFKFYSFESFNGSVSQNFYTDGVVKFFNHMFNVCGARTIELMRGTNESMFAEGSKEGKHRILKETLSFLASECCRI